LSVIITPINWVTKVRLKIYVKPDTFSTPWFKMTSST